LLLVSAASMVNSLTDPNTDTRKDLSLQVYKWGEKKKVLIHVSKIEAQIYKALLLRRHVPESHNALRLIVLNKNYGG